MIWAATAHFIRNVLEIENDEHDDYYQIPWQAGNRLAAELGDDLYTIAVTAYDGEIGDLYASRAPEVSPLDPAPPGSLEAHAHALGVSYGFIDLRHVPDEAWLGGTYVSVSLGRLVNTAPWKRVVDAFLFIDRAEPIRYVSR